mmetsp:Transcript_14513/g.21355  ORF Transcript_14513/g.21355 Transcript_14513/m.21355 type:complete len:311 (+) Transcript_14513:1099-2031(+)
MHLKTNPIDRCTLTQQLDHEVVQAVRLLIRIVRVIPFATIIRHEEYCVGICLSRTDKGSSNVVLSHCLIFLQNVVGTELENSDTVRIIHIVVITHHFIHNVPSVYLSSSDFGQGVDILVHPFLHKRTILRDPPRHIEIFQRIHQSMSMDKHLVLFHKVDHSFQGFGVDVFGRICPDSSVGQIDTCRHAVKVVDGKISIIAVDECCTRTMKDRSSMEGGRSKVTKPLSINSTTEDHESHAQGDEELQSSWHHHQMCGRRSQIQSHSCCYLNYSVSVRSIILELFSLDGTATCTADDDADSHAVAHAVPWGR